MIDTQELERRMRPGALSTEGFLGEGERLEEVLQADRLKDGLRNPAQPSGG